MLKEKVVEEFDFLMGLAVNMTKDRDRAEDLVQDAIENLLKSADRYEDQGKFKSYAATTIRNLLINRANTARRRERIRDRNTADIREMTADTTTRQPDPSFDNGSGLSAMLQDHLPPKHYTILMLFADGATYPELVEGLGISVGTVSTRLMRARENAIEVIEETGEYR